MADELYWHTVKPRLRDVLNKLMQSDLSKPFRLVGGTSLSLQLGHRMSDDIDLFTDEPYGSVDFVGFDKFLKGCFPYVSELGQGPVGSGVSYLVGKGDDDAVKLDLFYTDPFIQPAKTVGTCRLATVEEIIAMKIDIVQRKARKKDFWDIHGLLDTHSLAQMIALHEQKYPYNHDEGQIRSNLVDFSSADEDFDPVCLLGKHWELIKLDMVNLAK